MKTREGPTTNLLAVEEEHRVRVRLAPRVRVQQPGRRLDDQPALERRRDVRRVLDHEPDRALDLRARLRPRRALAEVVRAVRVRAGARALEEALLARRRPLRRLLEQPALPELELQLGGTARASGTHA